MPTRKADAVWEGNLRGGKGTMRLGSGADQDAKASCPVSKALAGVEITLSAKLAG